MVHVKHAGCHIVEMPNLGAMTARLFPDPNGFRHLLQFGLLDDDDEVFAPSTACPTSRAMSLRAQIKSWKEAWWAESTW